MTDADSNPMDALTALLEERRRYEGWLAQLDARRGESPTHVVERVRGDYMGRLESVTQKLRGRAQELETIASGLRHRVSILQGEESGKRDERAELELRALVGEYTPDQSAAAISACDAVIDGLVGERSGLEAELARVTDVLSQIAPSPAARPSLAAPFESWTPGTAAPAPGSEPPEADEPPLTQEMAAASALETSSIGASPASSPMDELAFLHSVVDGPRQEGVPASPQESSLPAGQPSALQGGADLLPPPVLSAPRRPVTPLSTSIPTTRDPFASTAKASALTPGSIPSFLKDMPTEQVKTLKCQECGTMNYPTEWYCERCGGELAAM
ncbi:MAG TPA: hypothetical protein VFV33_26540 [Gemmatimonadaceae bacterium]|nr:hypothetical protein [Gemmatimonadaceae bacterium]